MTDAKRIIIRREHDGDVRLVQATGRFHDRKFTDPVIIPGHAYVALRTPILIFGPNVVPGIDNARITWETDIAAYHRVRYRKATSGTWLYTGWTAVPNANADILLTGL